MGKLMKKILVLLTALIFITGCSSGGDSVAPTDPSTVFNLFPPGSFTPGNTKTTNYTGTDTAGGVYTATFSAQVLTESTFLGVPAIPVLGQLQLTNTANGGFVSVILTSYYSPLASDRHYLGVSSNTTTTVSSVTSAIPQTAKIGDFGVIGKYTDNAGDIDIQSWRIDDGSNGNADIVYYLL